MLPLPPGAPQRCHVQDQGAVAFGSPLGKGKSGLQRKWLQNSSLNSLFAQENSFSPVSVEASSAAMSGWFPGGFFTRLLGCAFEKGGHVSLNLEGKRNEESTKQPIDA